MHPKRPDLVAIEAQITHATRKIKNAEKSKEELVKQKKQLEVKVNALQQELVSVRKAAERAQGSSPSNSRSFWSNEVSRGATEGVQTQRRSDRRGPGGVSETVRFSSILTRSFRSHVFLTAKPPLVSWPWTNANLSNRLPVKKRRPHERWLS